MRAAVPWQAQQESGCKVIVVDPALNNTAAKADMWLAPRAGTDGDLFGAMLRYILENDSRVIRRTNISTGTSRNIR